MKKKNIKKSTFAQSKLKESQLSGVNFFVLRYCLSHSYGSLDCNTRFGSSTGSWSSALVYLTLRVSEGRLRILKAEKSVKFSQFSGPGAFRRQIRPRRPPPGVAR